MKSLFLHLACAVAAAFTLGVAAPALAECGDCGGECPKRKSAAVQTADVQNPAAGEKCECGPGGKGCVCKKGECKCANCGAKLSATGEKPKCQCNKGEACICKGECKCSHGTKKAG
jgi:hypothetical protein